MRIDYERYIELLKKLIEIPSLSREEDKSAALLHEFLIDHEVETTRYKNNLVAKNRYYVAERPTILLNSHHDTVKPNASWEKDPYTPIFLDGLLHGLGSNDAGGALVSLIAAFIHFYEHKELNYNLLLAATAEEEISGRNGIELVLPELGKINFAIVGEPTEMKMAIAEKGLMVLDCTAKGKAGHAARDGGDNAIYIALKDVEWFRKYRFDRVSELLGDIRMNVTMIQAGSQHNVVPEMCKFVVDVRTTDAYSNDEVLDVVRRHVASEVHPRSTRLQSSGLPNDHILLKIGKELGIQTFGSPTLSDQALMPFPSIKMGPGDSARSHTADEYIEIREIQDGIEGYISLLSKLLLDS